MPCSSSLPVSIIRLLLVRSWIVRIVTFLDCSYSTPEYPPQTLLDATRCPLILTLRVGTHVMLTLFTRYAAVMFCQAQTKREYIVSHS